MACPGHGCTSSWPATRMRGKRRISRGRAAEPVTDGDPGRHRRAAHRICKELADQGLDARPGHDLLAPGPPSPGHGVAGNGRPLPCQGGTGQPGAEDTLTPHRTTLNPRAGPVTVNRIILTRPVVWTRDGRTARTADFDALAWGDEANMQRICRLNHREPSLQRWSAVGRCLLVRPSASRVSSVQRTRR
jgi:hypothetical protein